MPAPKIAPLKTPAFLRLFAFLLTLSWVFLGWPQFSIDTSTTVFKFPPKIQEAYAAFPTVVGTQPSEETSDCSSCTITLPANSQAGDLIIAFLAQDKNFTATWPGAWVELVDQTVSADVSLHVGYLIATGGETSVIVTTSGVERSQHYAIRISAASWHGTTPPEKNLSGVAADTGSSGTPNSGSLTPSWGSADTLWISTFAMADPGGQFPVTGWPTNYTDNRLSNGTGAGSTGGIALATRNLNATSDDPGAFAVTGSEWWAASTIAVRPAVTSLEFEAEDFTTTCSLDVGIHSYVSATTEAGYYGTGYVWTGAPTGENCAETLPSTPPTTCGAYLTYDFTVTTADTYYVHLRLNADGGNDDSIHWGMDNVWINRVSVTFGPWTWVTGSVQTGTLSTGAHTFYLWMRESGLRIDRIVLDKRPYAPSDLTTTSADGIWSGSQRYIHYANGHYWSVFYDGTNPVIYSSSDAVLWNSQGNITADHTGEVEKPEDFAARFSGTTMIAAFSDANSVGGGGYNETFYRKATLNAGGTVTWWPTSTDHNAYNDGTHDEYMHAAFDSEGLPWILGTNRTENELKVWEGDALESPTWTIRTTNVPSGTSNTTHPTVLYPVADTGDMYGIKNLFWSTLKDIVGWGWDQSAGDWTSSEDLIVDGDLYGTSDEAGRSTVHLRWSVAQTSDGQLHLVYIGQDGQIDHLNTAFTTDPQVPGWASVATNVGASSSHRKVTLAASGDNLFVFYDKNDDKIYYREYNGSSWGTEVTLKPDSIPIQGGISAYESAQNNEVGVVWAEGSASPYDIAYATIPAAGVLDHFSVEVAGGGPIGTQVAGTPFNIQITAQDINANTVTGFTGTVDITSTGTLSGGSGATASFVLGVLSSHSVTISNSGIFNITATKTAGVENGTSNSFTVNGPIDLQQVHYRWRNDDGPELAAGVPIEASATVDTTTTNASYEAVAGMTLTPGAGDYLVWFSGSVEGTSGGSTQYVSLYVNGAPVTHTEREITTEGSIPDTSFPVGFTALVAGVGPTDAIEVHWKTTGGTATMHERTLVVQSITLANVTQAPPATVDTTTMSPTDEAVAGMTLTPGAGDYLVWFSGSVEGTLEPSTQNVSLYVNNLKVPHTEREIYTDDSIGGTSFPIMLQAYVANVLAVQAIEVHWRTTGGTATMHERTLVVQSITPADVTQAPPATADTTTTGANDTAVAGMTVTPVRAII